LGTDLEEPGSEESEESGSEESGSEESGSEESGSEESEESGSEPLELEVGTVLADYTLKGIIVDFTIHFV
jgi:hypothetical protein